MINISFKLRDVLELVLSVPINAECKLTNYLDKLSLFFGNEHFVFIGEPTSEVWFESLEERHHCKSVKKYSCGIRRTRASLETVWLSFLVQLHGKRTPKSFPEWLPPFAERSLARSRGLDVVRPDKEAMTMDGGWATVDKGNSSGEQERGGWYEAPVSIYVNYRGERKSRSPRCRPAK